MQVRRTAVFFGSAALALGALFVAVPGSAQDDKFISLDRTATATLRAGSSVQAPVTTALLKEPNLKSVDVNVETENGKVRLSGKVQGPADRDRVLKIASSVEGVAGVEASLTVR